jgi:hypothetical protein
VLAVLADSDQGDWTGNLMLSLGKANNFDMTLMFLEDGDRAKIEVIISKLSGTTIR